MVVQVAPAHIWRLPAPSLKIVSTSLLVLAEARTVEAVVLVKLDVVTVVPWWLRIVSGVPLVTPCTESTSIEGLPAVPTSA